MPARPFSIHKPLLGHIPRHRSLSALLNIAAATIGMTSLLLLVQIGGVASMAYEVQRLEDQRIFWQESNYRAEAEIARLQSLGRVEDEATTRLKMVSTKDAITVLMPGPLPARTSGPETGRAAGPRIQNSSTWWQGMLELAGEIWRRR